MALYFVDVEATGIDLDNDRIIQISYLKKEGDLFSVSSDLCYTDIKMSYAAIGVHHITPEMIEDKLWPYETDTFMELEKNNTPSNYFISHSNELDLAMIRNEELEIKMKLIDTDRCARHLLRGAEDYKLQTLRYQYGLYKKEDAFAKKLGLEALTPHDALSDVIWHYLLFEVLMEKVDNDIEKLVVLTGTPVLLEQITFGKYKGSTFEELFETNPGYFVWMYNTMGREWEDLEYTAAYWLQKNPQYWKKAQEERKHASWFE